MLSRCISGRRVTQSSCTTKSSTYFASRRTGISHFVGTSPTGGCYASEDTRTSEPSSSHSTLGTAFGELIVVLLLLKEIARQGNIPRYAVNTLQVSLVLTSAFIKYKRSQNCRPTAVTGLRRIKCRLHLSLREHLSA